jgi:hypothetical protein
MLSHPLKKKRKEKRNTIRNSDRIHEVSDGNEDHWELDICVTFWQKTYLHFVHALRFCRRLNIKVLDSFMWWRFQGNTPFMAVEWAFWLL